MKIRHFDHTWFPVSGLAFLLLALVTSSGLAAWKPIPPEKGPRRARLVRESGTEAGETLRGVWTILEPGASLSVPLTGSGRVRLQSRPLYDGTEDRDEYRFAVDLGDTLRRFVRRSAWVGSFELRNAGEEPLPGSREIVGLGDVDLLEFAWTAGTATMVVTSREEDRVLLMRVLLGKGMATPGREPIGPEGERRVNLDVEAPRLGYDSNAYLTAKNDAGREAKWFLPLDLAARWHISTGERADVQASYAFKGTFYDNSVLNETRHRAQLVGDIRLGSQKPRQGFDLRLAYRFTHKNDTYNGRGDREEFETIDSGTGTIVPLVDRFDYNEHRLLAGLGKYLGRRVLLRFHAHTRLRDYVQDYREYADIYTLDQTRLNMELALDWRLGRDWALTGKYRYWERNYDEKFSRDQDGIQVPNAPSELWGRDLIAALAYGRGSGLRLDGEIKYFTSTDRYAGYWDYSGAAFEVGAGWYWAVGHRLKGSLRYSSKDYDMARVDYDPAGILRRKSALNLRVKGDYVIRKNWEFQGSIHYKDADNNSEDFAYTRVLIMAGLAYRW